MSDDLILKLRVLKLTTSRLDLTGEIPLVAVITGRVEGPIDNLLPIMKAQRLGQPLVRIDLLADDEIDDLDLAPELPDD